MFSLLCLFLPRNNLRTSQLGEVSVIRTFLLETAIDVKEMVILQSVPGIVTFIFYKLWQICKRHAF
jgi:hypothetical protein